MGKVNMKKEIVKDERSKDIGMLAPKSSGKCQFFRLSKAKKLSDSAEIKIKSNLKKSKHTLSKKKRKKLKHKGRSESALNHVTHSSLNSEHVEESQADDSIKEEDDDTEVKPLIKEEDQQTNNNSTLKGNTKHLGRRGRLIVRNLPFKVTEDDIKKHFNEFGEIKEIKLLRKPDGKLVGCGFVEFARRQSAAKAIHYRSGKPLLGRVIILDWAVDKSRYIAATQPADVEIKDEPEDDVKIKDESDNDIEEEHPDIKEEDEEDSDDDEEEESSDDDVQNEEDRKPTSPEKKRVKSHDVAEGLTVFVKNIPFTATNEDLKTCMEQFGPVYYALVCIDNLTEHSKGTGFVKFRKKGSVEECLSAGAELTLLGQTLSVQKAIDKDDLQQNATGKAFNKTKDSRNLYLVKEGVVLAGSPASVGVSVSDMTKRLQLEQWKTQMLRNLNMFVSRNRLVVHNIPSDWDNSRLRKLFLKYSDRNGVITEARIMRDLRNVDADGVGKSKEFGFVSFTTHEAALKALRAINNNPEVFTPGKRPIVAFSIENRRVLNAREQRLIKSKIKNPKCKEYAEQNLKFKKGIQKNNTDDSNKSTVTPQEEEEVTKEYSGVTAKFGRKEFRSKFKLRNQAEMHTKAVRENKYKERFHKRIKKQKKIRQEAMRETQKMPKGKRKLEEDSLGKHIQNFSKELSAKKKKWYE